MKHIYIKYSLLILFLSLSGSLLAQDVLDQFTVVSYSNSNGSEAWGRDWDEEGDSNTGATGGYIRVAGGRLRFHFIYKNEEMISRSVDLTGAVSATLTFDWETISLTQGRKFTVQISSDGINYDNLGTFNNSQTGSFNQEITTYISSTTSVRFINRNTDWKSDDYAYVDNIEISFGVPVSSPPIVNVAKAFDETCNGSDGTIQFYETTPAIDTGLDFSIDDGVNWQNSAVFTGVSSGSYNLRVRNSGGILSANYPLTVGSYSALTATSNIINENCGVSDGSIDVSITGGRSGSLQTDGSTGMVDLQGNLLSGLGAFTLEGWVKLIKPVADYGTGQYSFFGQNDVIEFGFETDALTCWTATAGNVKDGLLNYPDDQKWHHVAVVGSGNSLTLYIDGIFRDANPHGFVSSYGNDTNSPAKIGAGVWDPDVLDPTEAVFTNVRFWNDERTVTEIQNFKDQNINGDEQGLIAVYKMDTPPDGNKTYGIGPQATVGIINGGANWVNSDPVYVYSWAGPSSFTSSNEDLIDLVSGTYDLTVSDLNGCSHNVSLNVGVIDVTAPVANVINLPDVIVGECSGTPTLPTATDDCAGIINGVSDVVFPITSQGTTIVTWSYDDGNGNISTQLQNVIVEDVTDPTVNCQSDIAHVLYCNRTSVDINVPTPTDNCVLQSLTYRIGTGDESVDLLSSVGLTTSVNLVTVGDHTITWTATDVNGNSNNCNFNLHVDTEPVINIVTASNITCASNNDGQIIVNDISVESGTIEYSIDGTNWQVSNIFTGLLAATYNITIRTKIGLGYCESAVKIVSVDNPSVITFNQSNLVDATCAASADGEIDINVSGGDQTMHFNGTDSYIALDLNYDSTTAIPEMTVAAWVKVGPNSGDGDWSILDFDRSEYFNFSVEAGYKLRLSTNSENGGDIQDFKSNTNIGDDQWHFVVGVYNGTDKYIYIDGILDDTQTNPHSGTALGSSIPRYAFIGTGSEASTFDGSKNAGKIFEGDLADVWYFESAITDLGELINLSNGTVPAGHTPKGYWRLNDFSNGVVSNLADPASLGHVFGSAANLYTFSCTKNGVSFSLAGIISEVNTNSYKLTGLSIGSYVLTATDNNGCSDNTSFIIASGDVTLPVISTWPADVTTCASDATTQTAIVSGIGLPIANYSDNCGGILNVQYQIKDKDDNISLDFGPNSDASGYGFSLGVNTVVYRVTDVAGNNAEVSFTVTVNPKPIPIGIFHN